MVGNRKITSISIFTSSDFPYGGAAENFVRLMAKGLEKNDHKVNVFLVRGKNRIASLSVNDTGIDISYVLFKKRLRVEFFKFLEIFLLLAATPVAMFKAKFWHKSNVILVYGIDYFYYLFPMLVFSRMLHIKCIRIVTDKYPVKTIVPSWWKSPKLFFYTLQIRYFDRFLHGMVFLSHFLKNQSIKFGVAGRRCVVIPHFIDIDQFISARNSHFKNQKIRIGYCGTITVNNGLLVLLRAFDLALVVNKNLELMLLGDPGDMPGQGKDEFDELIKKNEENILLAGRVSYDQISNKLGTCDILINPRISGEWAEAGFPTKIGEYLSCQKAVISTRVGDIPLYLEDNVQIVLINPDSPEEMAEKIVLVASDSNLRNTLSINGFEWVRDNLDYFHSAKRLAEFIAAI